MKTSRNICFPVLLLLFIPVYLLHAENRLMVARAGAGVLEVRLYNSNTVAGVQFTLRTSSDIALGLLERGDRTQESAWIVSSNKTDDSTINVLIMSADTRSFSAGSGSLVRIAFRTTIPAEISRALLTNVLLADEGADSLATNLDGLSWSEESLAMADANRSKMFTLEQNFPNPFNPSTWITYRLVEGAQVMLSVYDITGREVTRLIDEYQSAGEHGVEWNSDLKSGRKLASGLYFARLSIGNESSTRRMMLIK